MVALQKLNILHIVAAKEWGGGESCALAMCKAQREEGHRVFAVFDRPSAAFAERFAPFAEIRILSMRYPQAICSAFALRNFLIKRNIHVIHTHTGKVIPFAVLAGISLPTKLMAFRHNALPNKKDLLHRFLYRRTAAFLCVSKTVYEMQAKTAEPDLQSRFYQIYNGIDTALYDRREHPVRPLRREFLTLGYAGRIEENKGIAVLLEAMKQLRDARIVLRVAGDFSGEYARRMQQFCREHGLDEKVSWCGFRQDMAAFYDEIDILILPSIIPEAFGLVLCEAMYCGCAVIATRNGAQSEIVEDGESGYLVSPGSSAEIAARLKEYTDHPQRIAQMGENARNRIAHNFTMDLWKRNMEKIYAEVFS